MRAGRDLLARMLVSGDAAAHAIGLAIELALILLGEMAVVLGHIFLFVVLQALFASFEVCGLPGRELAALHAIGDAGLLTGFAAVDLIDPWMSGIVLACASAGSFRALSRG